jgi:hypothetical protein
MDSRTHALFVNADPDAVFSYVADIENLPRWAVNFCQSIERKEGFTFVNTPGGPMLFQLKADAGTGVIDFAGGPSTAEFTRWHSRVVPAPGSGTLFLFTSVRQPKQNEEEFEGQCALLKDELEHLRAQIEKAPDAAALRSASAPASDGLVTA